MQNGIPSTVDQHIKALDELGGLDVLGSPKTDNMYHAGRAWAGGSPYRSTKLIAAHFGGTRNPMAVRWPARIKSDAEPRAQFLHVNDVVPTIYDILGITPPSVVNGVPQDPFDGVSFAGTLNNAKAKGPKRTQYFDIMASRGIYHDGWMASAFGPKTPWIPGLPSSITDWSPDKDRWELYNLNEDWTQANDLADEMPEKLADLKDLFLIELTKNKGLAVGGALWVPALHPELKLAPPYTSWTFPGAITRMPEFAAPAIGNKHNLVSIDLDVPANANGVIYALGGFDLGSPVGIEYYDQAPFKFNGKVLGAKVEYLGADAKLNGKEERQVENPIPVTD